MKNVDVNSNISEKNSLNQIESEAGKKTKKNNKTNKKQNKTKQNKKSPSIISGINVS